MTVRAAETSWVTPNETPSGPARVAILSVATAELHHIGGAPYGFYPGDKAAGIDK